MSREGRPQNRRNAQRRLKQAINDANVRLEKLGIDPINEGVSPTPCGASSPPSVSRPVTIPSSLPSKAVGMTPRSR